MKKAEIYIALMFIIAVLILTSVTGCKVAKQTLTVHDTLIQKEAAKTETIYQDTGTTVTEYFPYFVHVKDTFYQPISKVIEKAGKTIHHTDSFYITQTKYVNTIQKQVERKPYIPFWVYIIFSAALIFTIYDIFKR